MLFYVRSWVTMLNRPALWWRRTECGFDFTHFSLVDSNELETIEKLVNRRIRENLPTHTQEMDAEDAFKSGATALFEEKYGDRVRVVSSPISARSFAAALTPVGPGISVFSESSVKPAYPRGFGELRPSPVEHWPTPSRHQGFCRMQPTHKG